MEEFGQILINATGAVAVSIVSYLSQKELTAGFFRSLDGLNTRIDKLNKEVSNLTDINHSIYRTLVKKTRKMEEHGIDPKV